MAARNSTKGGRLVLPANIIEELRSTGRALETIRCVVLTAVLALERQNADYDADIAMALKRGAARAISAEIERIGQLIAGGKP